MSIPSAEVYRRTGIPAKSLPYWSGKVGVVATGSRPVPGSNLATKLWPPEIVTKIRVARKATGRAPDRAHERGKGRAPCQ